MLNGPYNAKTVYRLYLANTFIFGVFPMLATRCLSLCNQTCLYLSKQQVCRMYQSCCYEKCFVQRASMMYLISFRRFYKKYFGSFLVSGKFRLSEPAGDHHYITLDTTLYFFWSEGHCHQFDAASPGVPKAPNLESAGIAIPLTLQPHRAQWEGITLAEAHTG